MRRYGWLAGLVALAIVLAGCEDSSEPADQLGIVGQAAMSDHFVTEWTGTTVTIDIYPPAFVTSPYSYNVDWDNDGVFDPADSGLAAGVSHTYGDNGPHTVRISGAFPGIRMGVGFNCGNLIAVKQWGSNSWESFSRAFDGCNQLSIEATDLPDLSAVTTMESAFRYVAAFSGPIGAWDVSNVKNMSWMFADSAINEDLGAWDTGSVTSMNSMFNGAAGFGGVVSTWDTSMVTNMAQMFRGASTFNETVNTDGGGAAWDVSSVTDMSYMFFGATAFNQPLDNWDMNKVTNTASMFWFAESFNQDISSWFADSTAAIVDVSFMFRGASAFNKPLQTWKLSNVTTLRGIFSYATSFNQPIAMWSTSNVDDMGQAFIGATSFNQPLGGWDTGSVTDMSLMFEDASSFNQDIGGWTVDLVADMNRMFNASAFNHSLANWTVGNVTDMSNMLDGTPMSKANYDATLVGWDGQTNLQSGVTVGASGLSYCAGDAARAALSTNFSWNFQGDFGSCCGNGILDGPFGEICDDGFNSGTPGSCSFDCFFFVNQCYRDDDGDTYGYYLAAPTIQNGLNQNVCNGSFSLDNFDCEDGIGGGTCGANCYPGNPASDICDGFDQNCDGQLDEDHVDTGSSCGVGACSATGTQTCSGGTIVDSCAPGTPAANDATCDGIDNDCNGQVDEDYAQQATSCGVGVCERNGLTSCVSGAQEDSCSVGTPTGSDASCNGLDDNCNGSVDENFASAPTACGVGACSAAGTTVCSSGTQTDTCTPGTPAANDATCDGVDDDCDGQVDEDYVPVATNCGEGACSANGMTSCVGGFEQDSCIAGTPAANDATCDGIDDDCDRTADEDYVSTQSSCGQGACAANGTLTCVAGSVSDSCTAGTPAPNDSVCNGIDDDCNGQVDEDYSKTPTSCGVGACQGSGELSCVGGTEVNDCLAGTPAANDATCDGVDDDCNGTADEDYVTTGTSCGQGACAGSGTLTCIAGVEDDSCVSGSGGTSDESCDDFDDDCDGQKDEDYPGGISSCGVGACASSGVLTCESGAIADSCVSGTPAANDATCDGIDDDCDGQVDEDYASTATACGVGACGASGTLSCVGGVEQDSCAPGAPAANDATCDGVDDDCDGNVDDNYFELITSCGQGACAASGTRSCVAGAEQDSCAPGTAAANDATCDGVDDDCNGVADEDYVNTATNCGEGACARAGTQSCSAGVEQDSCSPGTAAANDATCDLIDDDCDGSVDEDATSCFTCGVPSDCPALGNDCQQYACPAGVCVLGDKSSGAACDDGAFCTATDTCDGSGSCGGTGSPCSGGSPYCLEATTECVACRTSVDCPAPSNECQVRACTAGVCGFNDKPVSTTCTSDDNACNGPEQCLTDQGPIQCLSTGVNPCSQSGNNPACVDDGNDTNSCVGTCGDSKIGVGETCDRGGLNTNDANSGGCSTSCDLNTGWRCPGGASTCANPEPICGDGIVIGTREICDAGAANGTTECGCTATCTFVAQAANCDDGLYCNGVDTCNGAGVCGQHSGSPCSLGDAACRESLDVCDECLNSAQCDNGQACDGAEACDISLGLCVDGSDITCTGDFICDDTDGSCGCPAGQAETGPTTCDPIQCTIDDDCDDDNICNGVETCDTGTSQCLSGTTLTCTNGLACDGRETCDPLNGCQDGNDVTCSSSFECKEPSGTCSSKCGNGTLDQGEACDDGASNSNTNPDACRTNCQLARCGDGVQDGGEQCDDGNQQIGDGCSANCMNEECLTVADCDAVTDCETAACTDGSCFYNDKSQGTACASDGVFCTGSERCDGAGVCSSSGSPCGNPSTPLCDEGLTSCVECLDVTDCDDGVFCNGQEACGVAGACASGLPVTCDTGFICDAIADACVTLCGNGVCDSVETVVSCAADCSTGGTDTDGDGVSDAKEIQLGTDPSLKDTDGDSVPDGVEIGDVANPRDTDQDGLIDARDDDDDDDGIPTLLEDVDDDGDLFDEDDDSDGVPNFRDADDDGDGVPTLIEAFGTKPSSVVIKALPAGLLDSDEDGIPNYRDKDDDGDTILTANEVQGGGNAWQLDTDRDGIPNYVDNDDDGDTLLTADEVAQPLGPDFDNDGRPNYLDDDDDGDDVLTADEVTVYFSKPYDSDTDDDNLLDGEEVALGTSLIDDDTDDDGLLDGEEIQFNADPLDSDTDDDGLLDGDEIKVYQTNVRNPDTDDDGLLDGDEVFKYRTDPTNRDSDNDGFSDGEEIAFGSDANSDLSVPIPSDAAGGAGAGGGCTSIGGSPWTPGLAIVGLVGLGLLRRRQRK